MKLKTNRLLLIGLSLILILGVFPHPVMADSSGSFYLMAATESKMIIAPVRVEYEEGMSIRQALANSGYDFNGIDTNGFISAIEGYDASFSLFYDGGGYDLDESASGISAISFVENSPFCEEMISMIKLMGEYSESRNNVKNYPKAKEIYEKALDEMRKPEQDVVKGLYDELNSAIKEYEEIIGGEKYTVTVNAVKGEDSVTDISMTFTDSYGNITVSETNSVNLVAGKYTYVISDKGYNRAEGSFDVDGIETFNVNLPSGEWFGEIRILDASDPKQPYAYSVDSQTRTNTYTIPDTIGRTGTFLNAMIGDVPDTSKTKLHTIYVGTDGKDKSSTIRSWNSETTAITDLLSKGLDSREFTLEARYTAESGQTMIQSYNMVINRIPTLSSMSIKDGVTELMDNFEPTVKEYSITTVSDKLNISCKPSDNSYKITVDGNEGNVIDLTGKESHIATIVVSKDGITNTYTVNITKITPSEVTVNAEDGVSVEILNQADSAVEGKDGVYQLTRGEKYTYIATKDTYYHSTQEFVAQDDLVIDVVTPHTKDVLSDFGLYDPAKDKYVSDKEFSPDEHEYVYTIGDVYTFSYYHAKVKDGYSAYAIYNQQSTSIAAHGKAVKKELVTDGSLKSLTQLTTTSGYSQQLTVRLEKVSSGVTFYQDYDINILRSLSLENLKTDGNTILQDKDGNVIYFDFLEADYYIAVPMGTESILLKGTFVNEEDTTACCGGYYAVIQGKEYENVENITLTLDPSVEREDISIKVCHKDENSLEFGYNIHIIQQKPVYVTFGTSPESAIVYVKNNITGKRIPEVDGKFALNPGSEYTYTVTLNGYIGQKNEKYIAPQADKKEIITLQAAEKNENITIYDSWWSSFRADKNNNGIIEARTPVKADDAVMYWATKIGDGFDKNACGCPIIVDGYLYTYAGNTIYKVNTLDGKIVATGKMDHSSSFAVNPPTYADGMIFVGLAEGCVQAFSAETLESLWMYRDELGGQPNCTIYYHDGYIYTGFWLGETVEANYVCLSVTDEDPTNSMEEKVPTWTYTSKGGFYWAGAFVNDNFAIIGTDDGNAGYVTGHARVVTFSTKTGEVIDEITMPNVGDIRSGIVYYEANDEYYFTSKGGYLYGLKVDANGGIIDSSLRYIKLQNGQNIATAPPMSTSTPAVYNQRAYVGVSGISQFGAYSGHNICVLDLKNWEVAYTVPTQGYPQTSGILTTAYEEETGSVYVYFIDNYTPGKLRVIADKPNQTKPNALVIESYMAGGKQHDVSVGEVLFTPDGKQAQYAICSPIVDEYGTIYFKNDSAYLMAIGSTIEKLTVETLPSKLSYNEGEIFDATGMKVTATYKNGITKDVTEYVSYSSQPLTADDTSFEIRFEKVMYQDKDGVAGSLYTAPIAFVELEVKAISGDITPEMCDLNGDGVVNSVDISQVLSDYATASGTSDINKDGMVDSVDLSAILENYGIISVNN